MKKSNKNPYGFITVWPKASLRVLCGENECTISICDSYKFLSNSANGLIKSN